MGAVEDTRKVVQDFLAPEIRTITANIAALAESEGRLRKEIEASEMRLRIGLDQTRGEIVACESRLSQAIDHTRTELIASESRISISIERLRADLPLLIRNAVLEQMLAEKQRAIEEFQKQAH